jgi:hypothetical protein
MFVLHHDDSGGNKVIFPLKLIVVMELRVDSHKAVTSTVKGKTGGTGKVKAGGVR